MSYQQVCILTTRVHQQPSYEDWDVHVTHIVTFFLIPCMIYLFLPPVIFVKLAHIPLAVRWIVPIVTLVITVPPSILDLNAAHKAITVASMLLIAHNVKLDINVLTRQVIVTCILESIGHWESIRTPLQIF